MELKSHWVYIDENENEFISECADARDGHWKYYTNDYIWDGHFINTNFDGLCKMTCTTDDKIQIEFYI